MRIKPQIHTDKHRYFNPKKNVKVRDAMEYQMTPRSQLGAAS
jgi:hypothetical protein